MSRQQNNEKTCKEIFAQNIARFVNIVFVVLFFFCLIFFIFFIFFFFFFFFLLLLFSFCLFVLFCLIFFIFLLFFFFYLFFFFCCCFLFVCFFCFVCFFKSLFIDFKGRHLKTFRLKNAVIVIRKALHKQFLRFSDNYTFIWLQPRLGNKIVYWEKHDDSFNNF